MSARIPARRIGQSALTALKPSPTYWTCPHQLPLRTRRTLTSTPHPRVEKDISNPILEKYLEKQQSEESSGQAKARPQLRDGNLSPTSLFNTDLDTPIPKPKNPTPEALAQWEQDVEVHTSKAKADRDLKLSSLKLDPDPRGRRNWERKMVITSLRKRGRLTKAMKIAREERESHYKSPFLPTSIKKLTKVMNQIAGKTVEEALVQLRFSKKKVARDVWKGLKMARDEAIVARGMGLGKVQHEPSEEEWKAIQEEAAQKKADKIAEAAKKEADDKATREAHRSKDPKALENWLAKQEEAKQAEHERRLEQLDANDSVNLTPTEKLELLLPDGMRRPTKAGKATLIELKDGRSKRVHDPSEMYVDQAWVGRGTPGKSVEYRARGQMNILEHRTTCFSVVLKEEKTRMRISEEIKKKRASKKLWVALPDKPVTAQRQYCLW